MDIHILRTFLQLAGSLHFGRTSRTCNISPSALTRTVQRLEAELGEQLLVRNNRLVSLTAAGEHFRTYAEDVLRRWEQLHVQLAQDRTLAGAVSLYCSVTAAYSILPNIFQQFRKAYPQIHVRLQTGDAASALARLLNRETDLAIAALPEALPEQMEFLKLMETPLVFIEPFDGCRDEDGRTVDWQHAPIVMPETGLSRQRIDRWFADKKIAPSIYAEVAGNEAIIAMVGLGCGIGVVPRLVLEKSPAREQVRIFDASPQLTPFSIAVCTLRKKFRSPQVQAFWEIAAHQAVRTDSALRLPEL